MKIPLAGVVALLFPLILPVVSAKTIEVSPKDDWFSILNGDGLKPGDELVLKAGVYSDARRLEMRHRGTESQPIIIRGESEGKVVLKRPDAKQNTINMAGCQYLELKNIEITGGDAGIRIMKSGEAMAKFLLFENLHIHHIGGVAITANTNGNTYESLVFRHNEIHHTGGHGEAFYLGCNNEKDGSVPGYIFNSLVERNYIHDLKGGTVSQGDGIEIKDGSYGNIIRDNVIHDTNYPGIIVYGTNGKKRNLIERNVIWNTGDAGIQAAADVEIRNNIIYQTKGDGIHCRNHQSGVVGNLLIAHNTILSEPSAIRIVMPETLSGPVLVVNNAIGKGALRIPENEKISSVGNVTGVTGIFPEKESEVIGARIEITFDSEKIEIKDDFNGSSREGHIDAGAYSYSAKGNPGWKISGGFKK